MLGKLFCEHFMNGGTLSVERILSLPNSKWLKILKIALLRGRRHHLSDLHLAEEVGGQFGFLGSRQM